MALSREQVLKVAELSRLKLSEAEVEKFTTQLDAIIEYVEQLGELDVDGVAPLAHPLPLQDVFRDDVVRPSLTPDEALANAPRRHGDFFVVPPTLEQ
jgi:aspartyl-tRNA(Asn)/glutamyl-tRNA(Gln) amidotransferase subunit C